MKLVGSWLGMKERSQSLSKVQPSWVKIAFTMIGQKGTMVKMVCCLGSAGGLSHTTFQALET